MKLLTTALIFLILTGCVRKEEPQIVAPEQAPPVVVTSGQPEKSNDDVPSISEALTAAVRAHPRATEVCYDKHVRGFMIFYPYKEPDTKGQEFFDGWYYLEYDQIWKLDNNTWMMREEAWSKYVRVYPDVKGLDCKKP